MATDDWETHEVRPCFCSGPTTRCLGTYILTMVMNHLQVLGWSSKYWTNMIGNTVGFQREYLSQDALINLTLRLLHCHQPTLPSSSRCKMSHPVGLRPLAATTVYLKWKVCQLVFVLFFGRTWHLFILKRRYMLGYSTVTNRITYITCMRGHRNQVRSCSINPRFLWAPALVHGNYIEAVGRIRFAISSIFFVHVFLVKKIRP